MVIENCKFFLLFSIPRAVTVTSLKSAAETANSTVILFLDLIDTSCAVKPTEVTTNLSTALLTEIENNPSEFVLVASLAPFTVTVAAITGCPVASTIFPVIVFCCANADGTPASSNSMKTNCK